jgi:hypothetical protein
LSIHCGVVWNHVCYIDKIENQSFIYKSRIMAYYCYKRSHYINLVTNTKFYKINWLYLSIFQHTMLQNMIWRQVTYCNDSTKVQYLQRKQYYRWRFEVKQVKLQPGVANKYFDTKLSELIYFQVKHHSMLQNMIWRQVTYCNESTKVQYLQRKQYYFVVVIWV